MDGIYKEQIIGTLTKRYERNVALLKFINAELLTSNRMGRLNIVHDRGIIRYYYHKQGSQKKIYLGDDIATAKKIARINYYEALEAKLTQENQWIQRTLKGAPKIFPEDIYLHDLDRRSLINPLYLTDEEAIKQWLNKDFQHKYIDPKDPLVVVNSRNELMRSKSEALLSDLFFDMGIPYIYEYPLQLSSGIIVHPDFYIFNVKKRKAHYYEHFGRMSDPAYVEKNMKRIKMYSDSGITIGNELLASFEYGQNSIDLDGVRQMIIKTFERD